MITSWLNKAIGHRDDYGAQQAAVQAWLVDARSRLSVLEQRAHAAHAAYLGAIAAREQARQQYAAARRLGSDGGASWSTAGADQADAAARHHAAAVKAAQDASDAAAAALGALQADLRDAARHLLVLDGLATTAAAR